MAKKQGAAGTSILLVDDRREDLLALSSVLEDPHYNLVTANSGQEALRRMLDHDYAAVVLDVLMPDMNGFEVASLLRRRERSGHTPIIFLTGVASDVHYIYRAYSVGAVDYLMKPVDPDVLRAKVAIFVELFEKDRQIREQAAALLEAERRQRGLEMAQERIASDRRYRNLADAIPQIVWTADSAGAITTFNQRWHEYTGHAEGTWLAQVHADDRAATEERWRAGLERGQVMEMECRVRNAEGGYRWHLCRAIPERAADGKIIGWLGTLTDLDDLLRARSQTEAARHRTQFLADASAVLSASLDGGENLAQMARTAVPAVADLCVVLRNEADGRPQLSVACVEPAHQPILARLRLKSWPPEPQRIEAVDATFLSSLAEDGAHQAELAGLGLGSALLVPTPARDQTLGAILLATLGEARRYEDDDLAMAVDLGDRVGMAMDNSQLYQKAESAIRARDEFLSIASHELRTPLSALLLQLGALEQAVEKWREKQTPGNSRVSNKVVVALRQTRRLTNLVDSLLDVSRLATGRLQLHPETCDLWEVVREVTERFAEPAKEAGCELRVLGEPRVGGVWDRLRIEQVVTNLLGNALKYGPGRPVELTVRGDAKRAQLSVRDHGIGINAEDLPRIFNRFERAVPARQYGGLGLGLYISRQIIQAHGGSIQVTSRPGDGSTFTMELPRVAAGAEDSQSGVQAK